jgi:LuxR family transcriptional regulator, maltose regulon positive regulatory protein
LHVAGTALEFEGKVPKRPLALLKALVARGASQVSLQSLADDAWPDQDAAAAQDALNVALHRLRRLLGDTPALVLQEGRLSLDIDLCWVDALAFEEGAKAAVVGSSSLEAMAATMALYRGHFLAGDAEETWSVSARERLRSRFHRLVIAYVEALLQANRADDAMACFQRGIEIDDLIEPFYQGLLRAAIDLRRPAEGIAAYRRLHRLFSLAMGIAPAPETDRLLQALRESAASVDDRRADPERPFSPR